MSIAEDRRERQHALVLARASTLGVEINHFGSSSIRFHDERGSRAFTTPLDTSDDKLLDAFTRDVARMRGLRLMEILGEEWTLDRMDEGQRGLIEHGIRKLLRSVTAGAFDDALVSPTKAADIRGQFLEALALVLVEEGEAMMARAKHAASGTHR